MLYATRSAFTIGLLALITACGVASNPQVSSTNFSEPTDSSDAPSVTLTVGAASSLSDVFQEIGAAYTEETGTKVDFSFAATGQLLQQIEQGAPIDVFAAADRAAVEDLDAKGRVLSDTKAVYGRGLLVLWAREGSPLNIEQLSLEELLDPKITRVAIANPDRAPYGIAAREALESVGIWSEIQPKLILGENVAQTMQYAETGNVDVAFVPLSLALATSGKFQRLPEDLHNPIDQMLAVVEGTPHEAEARQFAEFVTGEQGRAFMKQYGFTFPEEPEQ